MKNCKPDCKCLKCVIQCMNACKLCEQYKKVPVTWCRNYSEQCRQITIDEIISQNFSFEKNN